MMDVYEKYGGIVISGVRIEKKEDLKRYGIADITQVEGNVYKINAIVEKPEPGQSAIKFSHSWRIYFPAGNF